MLFWCLAHSSKAARSAVLIREGELGPIGVVLRRIFDPILSQPGAQHELGALHAPLADRRFRTVEREIKRVALPSDLLVPSTSNAYQSLSYGCHLRFRIAYSCSVELHVGGTIPRTGRTGRAARTPAPRAGYDALGPE